ncbi:MAG: hypothetical protein L0Y66_26580 [Myxococcaceae bacterium]|nr:hypothetical protein [Myxococcaceae bacterium]
MSARQTLAQADAPQTRFEALLAEHRRIVLKVASTYCANAEDRRDVEQEICAQLWLGLPWLVLWIVAMMIGAQRLLSLDLYAPRRHGFTCAWPSAWWGWR